MKKIISIVFCVMSVTTFSVGAATAPAKPATSCNMAYQNCLGVLTGKGPAAPIVANRCFKEQKYTTNAYGKTQAYFTGKTICI